MLFLAFPVLANQSVYFPRGHFTLTLPAEWENVVVPALDYDPTLSAVLMKTLFLPETEGDFFREQIGITTEYAFSSSPEKYFDRVYHDTVNVPGVTALDQGTSQISDQKAHWFIYRWDQPEYAVIAKVYLLHSPVASHRFIYLAQEERFEFHLTDFDRIVSSFRLGE